MNTSTAFRSILHLLSLIASASIGFAQGLLTPPGPPAPTMKTLDQTEPRIPIESLPLTITKSGSYYFTRDLQFTGTSGEAILVNAPNATIDLMGFTLSSAATSSGTGIYLNANGCTVRNGSIVGTTTVTTSNSGGTKVWTVTPGGFATGVDSNKDGHRFIDLTVAKCRSSGISGNHDDVAIRCVVYENDGTGLRAGVVSECIAFLNASTGIEAGQNIGGVVSASRSHNNKGSGISAAMATNCTSLSNGGEGFNVIQANNCTASFNGENGITGFTVIGCNARSNTGHGIRVGQLAKDNESGHNGSGGNGAGIFFGASGARIEGNNCYNNDWGIQGEANTNSLIIRNSCKSNGEAPVNGGATGDYDFPSSNTFGPIVTHSGNMNTNAATSHPWANFRF